MSKEWDIPEVQALGEERLKLIREAAEKSRGKTGMERLDVLLEFGERLAEGGKLPEDQQKALLAAVSATLPKEEQERMIQVMSMLGY
ncbi:hypothetical protein [Anaerotignum propionicum]|uniref:Uncharacterized protein n=1 Tax=Anaerotignum propionicum DSM 1682 TaxID=991789 RepID=A0A0X8V7V0_ANAPI|nr:hypothetical protein [Anaerotignum propionicum]AMJ39756.1 hypothetical protein CPRO_01320 [Anaerotignum propionicum DSM 1682]MEA5056479.1 hypothetical protein [Anaerotignum propionicum]SHE28996.1 hypothetical protein SAMN02745151_00222 [[Clostridium] propionicum DSM 1682] [Anaerotignum propionicum DSM 1682]HBF65943.1 hypothetical protein [Clostridium sp.]